MAKEAQDAYRAETPVLLSLCISCGKVRNQTFETAIADRRG